MIGPAEIVGGSAGLRRAVSLMSQVAPSESTVLLLGETGTARSCSPTRFTRRAAARGPLVKVNCAAIPATLLESELFGHEKGAFTGASALARRLELADGGTLFLDEIATSRGRCRRSCCASCRTARCNGSARPARARWTCAS